MKLRRCTITAAEHTHRGVEILYTDRYAAEVNDKHLEALEFDEILRLIDGELDKEYHIDGLAERYYSYSGPVFKGRTIVDNIPSNDPMITKAVSRKKASSNFRDQLRKQYKVVQYLYSIDDALIIEH